MKPLNFLIPGKFLGSSPTINRPKSDFSVGPTITFSAPQVGAGLDLSKLVSRFNIDNRNAKAPVKLVGKSGVRHEFAFAVTTKDGGVQLVADITLSSSEVDETKVLAFFIKVFDVGAKHAVLCVTPRLNKRAEALAKQYGIVVLKSEEPGKLVGMLSKVSKRTLGS